MSTVSRPSRGWDGGSPSLIALGRFASLAFALVTVPIVARALGPDGRGIAAAMLAFITLITVAVGVGVPLAIRRRVATETGRKALIAGGRLFAFSTTLPATALGVLAAATMFRNETFSAQLAFVISMACVPFSVSWAQDVSVLIADRAFLKMAILGLLQSAATLAITLVLWLAGGLTVASVLYASLAGNLVTFAVGAVWVRAGIGHVPIAISLAREGFTLFGAQLADVASKRLDQIIALPLLGASGAGLYSVAATVASLSAPIAQTISAGMFSRMVGPDAKDAATSSAVIRYSIVAGIPTAAGMVVLSLIGIPLLFGSEFADAVLPAVIMSLAAPAAIAAYSCTIWLSAQERGRQLTGLQLAGLAVTIALFVVLSQVLGVVGAAIAMSAGTIVTFVLLAIQVARQWTSWFPRSRDVKPAFRMMLRGH